MPAALGVLANVSARDAAPGVRAMISHGRIHKLLAEGKITSEDAADIVLLRRFWERRGGNIVVSVLCALLAAFAGLLAGSRTP